MNVGEPIQVWASVLVSRDQMSLRDDGVTEKGDFSIYVRSTVCKERGAGRKSKNQEKFMYDNVAMTERRISVTSTLESTSL